MDGVLAQSHQTANEPNAMMVTRDENHDEQETIERDRHFTGYRRPDTQAAQKTVASVVAVLLASESRTRQRRPDDLRQFKEVVAAVVSEALYHHLMNRPEGIAVSRSKTVLETAGLKRYRSRAITGTLPAVLDALHGQGFIIQELGRQKSTAGPRRRTTFKAGQKLIALATEHSLSVEDFRKEPLEELIILKGVKESPQSSAPYAEYNDNDHTRTLRHRVAVINKHIADARIVFDESVMEDERVIDVREKRLRRVFTRGMTCFSSGGRLFGGFWMDLTKRERARGLTIDGERVVEVDYSSMGPHLLYAHAKQTPNFGDAYDLPGLTAYREGVKKVFNAMLFEDCSNPRTQMPKGARQLIPKRISYREVADAIKLKHRPIAHLLGTEVGHQIMYRESEIMVEVLLNLAYRDVVALPIHDAVLVKFSDVQVTKDVMETVSRDDLIHGIPTRCSDLGMPVALSSSTM
jgi:hypothetical protein